MPLLGAKQRGNLHQLRPEAAALDQVMELLAGNLVIQFRRVTVQQPGKTAFWWRDEAEPALLEAALAGAEQDAAALKARQR